jgi:hypothetical protein
MPHASDIAKPRDRPTPGPSTMRDRPGPSVGSGAVQENGLSEITTVPILLEPAGLSRESFTDSDDRPTDRITGPGDSRGEGRVGFPGQVDWPLPVLDPARYTGE